MENEVINTLKTGEKVTSTYAETYFLDDYCDNKQLKSDSNGSVQTISNLNNSEDDSEDWISPSDQLIGIVDLKPPFTSKITRGKTHEGILAIGNDILAIERDNFLKYLNNLLYENDSAWDHILTFEKAAVSDNVNQIYAKVFEEKSKIMSREIMLFFEETIRDLEKNIKKQVEDVLISTHGSIVTKLNADVKKKLNIEKVKLEKVLKKRFESEVAKLKKYYKLLLRNETLRNKKILNQTIVERNDAIKAFMRQVEAENISSSVYVMCTERKKCKIKQFLLENFQTNELKEKYQKLKERQDIIDMYKDRETHISQINSEWEEKIKKILQLFLKFISFSLKLLPEQTSFLLNFEKMVVLQLNEMQKMPHNKSSILINKDSIDNIFKFENILEKKEECTKDPFVVMGGYTSGTPSTQYGSRESIPDDVDLPAVRLQRQFVYAKCHHYEEIKERLEAERCKCMDYTIPKPTPPEPKPIVKTSQPVVEKSESLISSESFESLLIDDFHRHEFCPVRNCQTWYDSSSFPYLNAYLDFDDEKYEKVVTILGKNDDKVTPIEFIDPKKLVYKELQFAATTEPYHNVETQYSSQEEIYVPDLTCPCIDDQAPQRLPSVPSHYRLEDSPSKIIADNMIKRRNSLKRLLQQNPKLMKTLTDESYNFIF